jgi:ankyrin repeat protein
MNPSVAVTVGNIVYVKDLLKSGVHINYGCVFGPALTITVKTGQLEIARLLLKHGAEVNPRNHHPGRRSLYGPFKGWHYAPPALYTAVLSGNDQLARLLLNEKYLLITHGPDYKEAIYAPARGGHEDMIWFLINKWTQLSGLTEVKSRVMTESARAGRVGIIKMMLSHGVLVDFQGPDDHTALHRSCEGGYLESVRLLLKSGADANVCCNGPSNTTTALMLAKNNGHLEAAKYLLENSALVDTQTWNSCSSKAAGEGHLDMVRFLYSESRVNLSAKIEISPGWWRELGLDMLIMACLRSHYDVVRLLVTEHGINPKGGGDNLGQDKFSPMMLALGWGNEKLMSMLLAFGALRVDPRESGIAQLFAEGTLPRPVEKWGIMNRAGIGNGFYRAG